MDSATIRNTISTLFIIDNCLRDGTLQTSPVMKNQLHLAISVHISTLEQFLQALPAPARQLPREQRFHRMTSTSVVSLLDWLSMLTTETNADESPIHQFVHFQIIPIGSISEDGYTDNAFEGVALCNHCDQEG